MTTKPIRCSEDAAEVLRPSLPKRIARYQECFMAAALDAKHQLIGRPYLVAVGTVNSVEVQPRDVLRTAIKRNAVAVIVFHNHPSGDPEHSDDDLAVTQRLKLACETVGVTLLDHLVITKDGYVSAADKGLLIQ